MKTIMWRIIKDFPNYVVSSKGNVKSIVSNRRLKPWMLDRYLAVSLVKKKSRKHCHIHKLVLIAFKTDRRDEGLQCNHIDGNKLNNNACNLEWVTLQENITHAHKNNLVMYRKGKSHPQYGKKGELSHHHKLTNTDIFKIRKLVKEGRKSKEIAKMFEVNYTTIDDIRSGRRWSHI